MSSSLLRLSSLHTESIVLVSVQGITKSLIVGTQEIVLGLGMDSWKLK